MSIASKLAGMVLPPPFNFIAAGLGWIKDMIVMAAKWAIEHPWQAAFLFLALWMVVVQTRTIPAKEREIAVQAGAKNILAKWFVDERRAYNEFIIKVELARKVAAELDRQNVERFKQEAQSRISEIEHENIELRDSNRRLVADRLRGGSVRTTSVSIGGGRAADLPVLSEMPGGAVSGAGAAVISESDALICADNYSSLTSLIAAWKAVEAVDVNDNGGLPPD